MARRQRRFTVFSLSFLDIMSCGFGATVLVFMLIHHSTLERSDEVNAELLSEVAMLEDEIASTTQYLTEARNDSERDEELIIQLEARVRQLTEQIAKARDELAEFDEQALAERSDLAALMADVRSLEEQKRRLEGAAEEQKRTQAEARTFLGAGDRQYLTGLKLGGRNVVILLDASASMLDETIVNIVRLRNMAPEQQHAAAKWRRAREAAEWVASRLPETSDYQVWVFNETARPLLPERDGEWFEAGDPEPLAQIARALDALLPEKGTSLSNAFAALRNISPLPDNLVLITDGLPTQGATVPSRGTVTANARLRHYRQSLEVLPFGIPVNTILFPMEGDPAAASEFWRLAMSSGGSFMSPAEDWP